VTATSSAKIRKAAPKSTEESSRKYSDTVSSGAWVPKKATSMILPR
jgi:hypothetical protein